MPGEINRDYRGSVESPSIMGNVVASTPFTYGGQTYVARAMIASADGTINVILYDGTAFTGKQVVKGLNVFQCIQVTSLGGLTLEWQA